MSPPLFPIDTPAKVTQAREFLELDKAALARELRLGNWARQTVLRIEAGGNKTIPGPVQLALEYLVSEKLRANPGATP